MIWGDGVAQRVNQAASPAGVGQILFASVALNLGEPSFVGSTLEECPKEVTGSWWAVSLGHPGRTTASVKFIEGYRPGCLFVGSEYQ